MADRSISELIQKYELAISSGKGIYLDADEFCDLIDYFDSADDLDEAKSILEMALSIHPDNQALLLKKAKAIVYDGNYQQALAFLDEYFSEYDFDLFLVKIECYLQLGLFAEASHLTQRVLADNDIDKDILYSELGFLYVEADKFEEAINYLSISLEFNSENLEVLGDLTYCYEMISDYDKSIDSVNKMLDIDPYSFDAWVNLGKLYTLQEDFVKAVDAFEFAQTINGADSALLKLSAHCLSLCNRVDEAIAKFEEYQLVEPDDIKIYLSLAECYVLKEEYEEALEYIDKYILLDNEDADTFVKKAKILLLLDRIEEAQKCIDDNISRFESSKDVIGFFLVKGDLSFKLEDFETAELFYNKAIVVDQESELALDKLATLYISTDSFDKAITYLERLEKINPDYPKIRNKIILTYLEAGDAEAFTRLLNDCSIKELQDLLLFFYTELQVEGFGSEKSTLINRLTELQQNRIYFKNIKF